MSRSGRSAEESPRHIWKGTKEYLNHRGTKIRVFSSVLSGPFPPTLFPSFSPPHSPNFSLPLSLQALFTLPTSPLFTSFTSPVIPPFLGPGKLRFRYPSDFGTLQCPADILCPWEGSARRASELVKLRQLSCQALAGSRQLFLTLLKQHSRYISRSLNLKEDKSVHYDHRKRII